MLQELLELLDRALSLEPHALGEAMEGGVPAPTLGPAPPPGAAVLFPDPGDLLPRLAALCGREVFVLQSLLELDESTPRISVIEQQVRVDTPTVAILWCL